MSNATRRAFILGLDGVPWELLEGFLQDGELPNFQRLLTEGASGPLESSTPANTPVAWPSIATGTWPDKHGLYEFMKLDAGYKQSPYSSADIRQPPLWELLSPAIVGNVPMTYPATNTDENTSIVSGMMTPEMGDDAITPDSLRSEFATRCPDYRIDIKWREYAGREREFLTDLDDLLRSRRELMQLLMKRESWELFFFVYVAPDRLQHLIWDHDILLEYYRTFDDILGDVMGYCDRENAILYVVSDHGFAPIEGVISVNRILADENLLATKDDDGTRGALSDIGLNKSRIRSALRKVRITDEKLVRTLPKSVVDFFAERIPGSHGLYDVDFARTDAFLHGLGSVYINDTERFEDGTVPPEAVDRTKREVVRVLETAEDPTTGDRLLTVEDGAKLFPNDPEGPDIVVEPTATYHIEPKISDEVVEPATDIAAYHRPEGIFFAWGDDVRPDSSVSDATVVDVAPTVLHSLGRDIPEMTDGRVLDDIFRPDSAPATDSVQTDDYGRRAETESTARDSGTVEDRLRGLGYME